jgi:hypothetical protein
MQYLAVFKSREKFVDQYGELNYFLFTEGISSISDDKAVLYAEDKADNYNYDLLHVHNTSNNKQIQLAL